MEELDPILKEKLKKVETKELRPFDFAQALNNMQMMNRTQAALKVAIPQIMVFMAHNGYPPDWKIYRQSTGFQETVENLQMTKKDILDFETLWNEELFKLATKAKLLN